MAPVPFVEARLLLLQLHDQLNNIYHGYSWIFLHVLKLHSVHSIQIPQISSTVPSNTTVEGTVEHNGLFEFPIVNSAPPGEVYINYKTSLTTKKNVKKRPSTCFFRRHA